MYNIKPKKEITYLQAFQLRKNEMKLRQGQTTPISFKQVKSHILNNIEYCEAKLSLMEKILFDLLITESPSEALAKLLQQQKELRDYFNNFHKEQEVAYNTKVERVRQYNKLFARKSNNKTKQNQA